MRRWRRRERGKIPMQAILDELLRQASDMTLELTRRERYEIAVSLRAAGIHPYIGFYRDLRAWEYGGGHGNAE